MKSFAGLFLLLSALWLAPMQQAAAAAPFTVTATNVTMGTMAVSQFTVTGIPLTGTLAIGCAFAGESMMASKAPICPMTPPQAPYQVIAGGSVKGAIAFYPPGGPIPAGAPVAGAMLAGALLLGVSLQRRAARGLLAMGMLGMACLAGMTGCGGSSNGMTPGTYPFTISATNESGSTTPLGQQVSTTITVTVP